MHRSDKQHQATSESKRGKPRRITVVTQHASKCSLVASNISDNLEDNFGETNLTLTGGHSDRPH